MPSEQQSNHKQKRQLRVQSIIWLVLLVIVNLKKDVRADFAVFSETNCTQGLLTNGDNFRVEGIINATGTDIASHPLVYFSSSQVATSGFSSECSYNLSKCSSAPPFVPFGCYCVTSGPDTYKTTFRRPASDIFNNVLINVTWKSQEIHQLPFMYDVCATPQPCTFGTDRRVTYCCPANTAHPCSLSIEYRNSTVSGTPCATLNLPADFLENETLSFNYTVCGQPCPQVFTTTCSPDLTTAAVDTSTTPGTANTTAPDTPVVECSFSCQVVAIVIGVVTGVGICAVAAYVLYLQMSKGASGKDKKHGPPKNNRPEFHKETSSEKTTETKRKTKPSRQTTATTTQDGNVSESNRGKSKHETDEVHNLDRAEDLNNTEGLDAQRRPRQLPPLKGYHPTQPAPVEIVPRPLPQRKQ